MAFSSTTTPGHTRTISSSLVTTSPFAEANTQRISSARLPSCTGIPSRDNWRWLRWSRNEPNLTSSPFIEFDCNLPCFRTLQVLNQGP